MQAHANDLRSEIEKDPGGILQRDSGSTNAAALDRMVHDVVGDWRQAPLRKEVMLLCEYAEAITLSPSNGAEERVRTLRKADWTEKELLEALQVVSYFNYINRMAESLGVSPEPGMPTWGRVPDGQKGGTL